MRLKFTLTFHNPRQRSLPSDYRCTLAAWIDHLLNDPDGLFLQRLREKGYLQAEQTRFTLYTFSPLDFEDNDPAHASFILSMSVDHGFEFVLQSVFYGKSIAFEDDLELNVTHMKVLDPPHWGNTNRLRLRLLSPLFMGDPNDPNYQSTESLSPHNPNFSRLLFQHLINKFLNLRHLVHDWLDDDADHLVEQTPPPIVIMQSAARPQWERNEPMKEVVKAQTWMKKPLPIDAEFTFTPLNEPQYVSLPMPAQGTTVEAPTHFDFDITAPTSLLRLGYEAGFGEQTQLGLGFVETLPDDDGAVG